MIKVNQKAAPWLRLVDIMEVEMSEAPFRLIKKTTGVTLGSFVSFGAAIDGLMQMDLEQLACKPVSKIHRGDRRRN